MPGMVRAHIEQAIKSKCAWLCAGNCRQCPEPNTTPNGSLQYRLPFEDMCPVNY